MTCSTSLLETHFPGRSVQFFLSEVGNSEVIEGNVLRQKNQTKVKQNLCSFSLHYNVLKNTIFFSVFNPLWEYQNYLESTCSCTVSQPFWAILLFNCFQNPSVVTETNAKTVPGLAK